MSSTSSHPAADPRGEVEHDEEVVEGQVVDDRKRRGARLDVGLQQSRYTSPLPSPEDLDRYVAHLPDAAERLMAAGEREQEHRHQIENRLAAIDEKAMPQYYAGQRQAHIISLILGLAYLGVMVLAIREGYPLIGAGGAAFGVAAVIWAIRRDPSGPEAPNDQGAGDTTE